mmetsp:Transcript_33994/g.86035  ORF Transcript_33994/g.86035 Transcript_33994/m.86035 type:complete len:422 (-) Transcript_33994:38-1303(-)
MDFLELHVGRRVDKLLGVAHLVPDVGPLQDGASGDDGEDAVQHGQRHVALVVGVVLLLGECQCYQDACCVGDAQPHGRPDVVDVLVVEGHVAPVPVPDEGGAGNGDDGLDLGREAQHRHGRHVHRLGAQHLEPQHRGWRGQVGLGIWVEVAAGDHEARGAGHKQDGGDGRHDDVDHVRARRALHVREEHVAHVARPVASKHVAHVVKDGHVEDAEHNIRDELQPARHLEQRLGLLRPPEPKRERRHQRERGVDDGDVHVEDLDVRVVPQRARDGALVRGPADDLPEPVVCVDLPLRDCWVEANDESCQSFHNDLDEVILPSIEELLARQRVHACKNALAQRLLLLQQIFFAILGLSFLLPCCFFLDAGAIRHAAGARRFAAVVRHSLASRKAYCPRFRCLNMGKSVLQGCSESKTLIEQHD